MVISVIAIVWGALGIQRSQDSGIGKARAVWGLVLGSIALVVAIIVWGSTLSQAGPKSLDFDKARVEQNIARNATKQRIQLSEVTCPAAPRMTRGEEFQCVAKAADGSGTSNSIRVQDDAGSIVWLIFDRVGVQQQIVREVPAQRTVLASVSCPAAPSMKAGDQFQCVASAADGSSALVNVTWQDNVGSLIWKIG